MKLTLCCAVLLAVALAATADPAPFSDELIAHINNLQTTWTAGRNFPVNTTIAEFKNLLGVLPRKPGAKKLPLKIHAVAEEIPDTFDARKKWANCADIIGEIRDQANCGSCWAFGAVEAMSDRYCIASNGETKIRISAEDLNDCCWECGLGCNGGWPDEAWLYWAQTGIVTGGLNGAADQGCKAYSIVTCDHHIDGSSNPCPSKIQPTPDCVKSCDDGTTDYNNDLRKGSAYSITQSEEQIQTEIMTNGPVEADFDVYEDFEAYKTGVYQHTTGEYAGGHAIKILGWGVENNVKYWLVANSWNTSWGDKGFFKILRGENHCNIEADIVAGTPTL